MLRQFLSGLGTKAEQTLYGLAFLCLLALIFTATYSIARGMVNSDTASIQPTAEPTDEVLPTIEPRETPNLLNIPTPQTDDPAIEALGPGGDCISGFVIDHYHQRRGENWGIKLTSTGGEVHDLTVDGNGEFKSPKLPAGTWTVSLDVPPEWQAFTPDSFSVQLTGESNKCANVRFKLESLSCLTVYKRDAATLPQSQIGLPGWNITAKKGEATLQETTDGMGKVTFENLENGEWTINVESQAGWIPTDNTTYQQKITLVSPRNPGQCEEITFFSNQVHEGCVTVWLLDGDSNPLIDWKIELISETGTYPPQTQQTDSEGRAVFNVPLGRWTVKSEVKEGWSKAESLQQTVEITQPNKCKEISITPTRKPETTCIDGYTINQFHQGLPNWEITAINKETGERFETTTNSEGYFKFLNLSLGPWILSEVQQPGWTPVTVGSFELVLTEARSQGECVPARFKNKTETACLDVYKVDTADNSGLPNEKIIIRPEYGGQPQTGHTDGTGIWRFHNLPPGHYIVETEEKAGWNNVGSKSQKIELKATGMCQVVTFQACQELSEGCQTAALQ